MSRMGDDSDDWDGLEDEDDLEQLAVVNLCDPDDPTLLTRKELKKSWGSCTNFMLSYGLKPYNPEDIDEALAISRALKEIDDDDAASRLKIWIDGASKVIEITLQGVSNKMRLGFCVISLSLINRISST